VGEFFVLAQAFAVVAGDDEEGAVIGKLSVQDAEESTELRICEVDFPGV
jgi:hypothetical protein